MPVSVEGSKKFDQDIGAACNLPKTWLLWQYGIPLSITKFPFGMFLNVPFIINLLEV